MKRAVVTGTALAGLVALASGCVVEPESGIVTEMEYEEAETETTQECKTVYSTRNGRTTSSTVCTPDTIYHPECYEVDYEDPETEATGEDCVSEELYEVLEIGDEYWKGMKPNDVA